MTAIEELIQEPTMSTQPAPSGPIDSKYHSTVAANPPEVHVVTRIEYVDGVSVARALGVYWELSTAVTVAAAFGAQISTLEIGLFPQMDPRKIH